MNKNEFVRYLELYGSDVSRWPGEVQIHANAAIEKQPELVELLKQERDFESILDLRKVENHSTDFQNRIISTAAKRDSQISTKRKPLWSYLNEGFSCLKIPKPVISLGIILIIGITIGYLIDNSQISKFRNESDIGVIALYEGEIYDFEY